jgi:hypothetical protein
MTIIFSTNIVVPCTFCANAIAAELRNICRSTIKKPDLRCRAPEYYSFVASFNIVSSGNITGWTFLLYGLKNLRQLLKSRTYTKPMPVSTN